MSTIVVQENIMGVIEIITQGPQGIPGAIVQQAAADGDFLRWNDATKEWQVRSEPLLLKGIVLEPQDQALLEQEGSFYYNRVDKTLKICVED